MATKVYEIISGDVYEVHADSAAQALEKYYASDNGEILQSITK